MQSMVANISRVLSLPLPGTEMFFLWGPRQAGKSTLLKQTYPGVKWVDLLKADAYRRFSTNPEYLRQELAAGGEKFVVIDEIQKVPALLDEVHWLHENEGVCFALCGSSARKLKRGHGNLLGGRGLRYELFGFCSQELGADFDLDRMLNNGTLPRIYLSSSPSRLLDAYVSQYLKEEIMAEGLVRHLPPFSHFLEAAAFSDASMVNFSTIARDVGVSRETIRAYFEILVDTLVGRMLPPFRKRPKRRVSLAEKFYFSDVGVANFLAKRGNVQRGSEAYGRAFENWVFHELNCYNAYAGLFAAFSYWRLSSGAEVDFVVNDMQCAIECKSSQRIRDDHLKGLRELAKDHPEVKMRILVGLEPGKRLTPDGIWILHAEEFTKMLWKGEIFS
jgi:predicted AAA+ superfamily ATPase